MSKQIDWAKPVKYIGQNTSYIRHEVLGGMIDGRGAVRVTFRFPNTLGGRNLVRIEIVDADSPNWANERDYEAEAAELRDSIAHRALGSSWLTHAANIDELIKLRIEEARDKHRAVMS